MANHWYYYPDPARGLSSIANAGQPSGWFGIIVPVISHSLYWEQLSLLLFVLHATFILYHSDQVRRSRLGYHHFANGDIIRTGQYSNCTRGGQHLLQLALVVFSF